MSTNAVDLQQPAQRTALSVGATGFVPGWTSPDQGLILRSSLYMQPVNSARALINMRWNGFAWTTEQTGYTRHRATTFNAGAPFMEFGVHSDGNGNDYFIQQVGEQVQLYDPTANPATAAESVLFTAAAQTIPCMRSFQPQNFIYVNGIDQPQNWDVTTVPPTWEQNSGWPVTIGATVFNAPSLAEVFNGRAAFAGFDGNPFAIVLSYFLQPTNYNYAGVGLNDPSRAGVFFTPSELGPIVTIKSFRINTATNEEVLLIGCQKGFCFVQGTDANSFSLVNSSARFGFVSNRCWAWLDGTAYALCTDGIRPFPGNVNFSALVSQSLTYPVHPLVTGMSTNFANTAQAFVIDNPMTLEMQWYFPGTADTHNRQCIIMNYELTAQGVTRFSQRTFPSETTDPGTFHAPSCGVPYHGLFLAGGYNGYLQHLWSGNLYNTTGISFTYSSPPFKSPTPAQTATARGFWIETEGPTQNFTVTSFYHMGQTSGGRSRIKSITINNYASDTAGETILGEWVMGESAFGGAQPSGFEYNPVGVGKMWEITITGNTASGDFSLVGIFSVIIGGGTRG